MTYRKLGGSVDSYFDFIEQTVGPQFAVFQDECYDPALRILRHYFLPPCGNSTVLEPPTSVCMETCNYLQNICPSEWNKVVTHFDELEPKLRRFGATFINCSDTGKYLNPLPYCCSNVGIGMSSSVVTVRTDKR